MNTIKKSENMELNEKYHYGIRAECMYDVTTFEQNLKENKLKMNFEYKLTHEMEYPLPDVHCELEINLDINQIREIMNLQTDSHVMFETINIYDDYTGEKYYQLCNL